LRAFADNICKGFLTLRNMAKFKEGNQFWRLRSKHGRDAIFTDPNVLLEAAYEYFEATNKRKWFKREAIKSGDKAGTIIEIETETPYSDKGLCMFFGVHSQYLKDFKQSETYKSNPDFSLVIAHVEEVIDMQQMEGSVVGTFNPNIISRVLGLSDKTETKTSHEVNPELTELLKSYMKINEQRNRNT
jgi:hypothetical protein